jgi:alpha-beta hydrolase superfamily lysophospholipase
MNELGPDFQIRNIPLRPDDEGEVVATLVKKVTDAPSPRAVLYIHGYADYFFQKHLAQEWSDRGFDFYALDLRKFGRSLRPWQTPNYVTDLSDYDEELSEALRIIRSEDRHEHLTVLAHSMGALVAVLWAHRLRRTGAINALILNSPWFDVEGNWFRRNVLAGLVNVLGVVVPRLKVGELAVHYGHALHVSMKGTWDYNLQWKPFNGFPALAGWARAVRRGQMALKEGLAVDCPVLVLTSDASDPGLTWSDAIGVTDSVLNVRDMWRLAPKVGADVTVVRIPDGMHDLALSAEPARKRFFDEMFTWIQRRLET